MSKKFCSILLIVTMLLTLVPLGAWAEEVTADTAADELLQNTVDTVTNTTLISETVDDEGISLYTSASGSSISVDKSSAKVNNNLEFILDLDTAVDADQQVVIFAERSGFLSDSDTITVEKEGTTVADADTSAHKGYFVLAAGNKAGEYTVKVKSASAGTVTMKAYVVKEAEGKTIAQIYNGDNTIIKSAFVGNGCTGKFNAVSSEITFDTVVTMADGNAFAGTNGVYYGAVANDGVNYYKVDLRVTKGGSKLVGEKVTISVDKNGATLSKEEATTSATGKVDFKVYANKAGTYTVTVECGSMSQEYKFAFSEGAVSQIKIDSVTDKVVANVSL